MRLATASLLTVVLGCAPPEPPPPVDEPCALVPIALDASEGGRARATVSTEPAGDRVALVSAPQGWDVRLDDAALTARVPYGAAGSFTVKISVQCETRSVEAEVPVTVRALKWTKLPAWTDGVDGPRGREHTLMWIDETDPDRLLLFGGYLFVPQQFTLSNDAWQLDLASGRWTQLSSPAATPMRVGGRLAQVPGQRAVLLLGGEGPGRDYSYSLQRHAYAPESPAWASEPATGTGARGILGSFVYDAPRNRFVSACGYTGAAIHCGVKTLKDGAWADVSPGPGPSGRYGFFHAVDAESERLILFSGAQAPSAGNPVNPARDTWALELGVDMPVWSRLDGPSDVGAPLGRRNGCTVLDPEGHRMFVFGGTADGATAVTTLDALSLDRTHEAWSAVSVPAAPPPRASCTGVYDAKRKRALFGFGNSQAGIFTDLWALEL